MKNVLNTDLTGKVAVVTGAGGVLCSQFAAVLARAGAKVALLDINEEAASAVAQAICEEGGTARAYRCDVLSAETCRQVADQVQSDLGPCDIEGDLDAEVKSFFDLDADGVSFVFNLNFLGTLLPTQAFARQMLGRPGCNILNISSMNAFTPLTKIPAYSGAKAAISNFTQWLAVHFSKAGIRVNAIAPGFFVTKQNEKMLFDDDGNPTPRTGKILAATPMGRFGKAEELSGAVLFLLNNEAASFITGVVLPIDGGFSAYSGV